MWMSTAACISILMMTSTVTGIEDLVKGTAAEELSEHVFRITEHEWESTKDEVILERIMPSPMLVVAIVSIVVS